MCVLRVAVGAINKQRRTAPNHLNTCSASGCLLRILQETQTQANALCPVILLLEKEEEQIMRTFAKAAMVLGFVGFAAGAGMTPANAFSIDVPGVHVHVGPHHHYWGPHYGYGRGYYDYAPCPRGFTVQDGVCKPYRGY
jgi:hypothetical protein